MKQLNFSVFAARFLKEMQSRYTSETNPTKKQFIKEQHSRVLSLLREDEGSDYVLKDRQGREIFKIAIPSSINKKDHFGWAVSEAISSDESLKSGNFKNQQAQTYNFKGGDFRGSAFNDSVFVNVKFDGSDLSKCNFSNATLKGCSFKNCNLRGAIFLETENSDCDFTGASLSGTEFIDSDFSSSHGIKVQPLTLVKNSKLE